MVDETLHTARILIVDDERAMVYLLGELLSHAGYGNIRSTSDPREALTCVDEFQPDLILLDLRMPHLDGLEVLRQLKARSPLEGYLPVLVLTADVSRDSRRTAFELGAGDFVSKPFEQTELLLRVRNLLEMRFLHRDLRRRNETLEAEIQERTRQLIEAEKLATMGNLLAGVAHELNSPLSVILGQAGLCSAETTDAGALARVREIAEAAERCVRIVRSFLTMARRHTPERGPVSLNHVLRDAADLLAFELRIANVEVEFDLPDDVPPVWADGHQLKQVVLNLITNARQAMQESPSPRRLRLATRHEPQSGRAHMEIADTGPGIPADIQTLIFNAFFTTKPEGEGTGLGLALARGIVEEHGGTISVESRPGDGARFRVEVPLGAPLPPPDEPDAFDAGLPLPGKTILVVDDEPQVASLLAEALLRDGYLVDTAPDGATALAKLAAHPYDLVISDSGMPGLSGSDLYRELERREPTLARRFVFITGDTFNPRTRAFLARTGRPQLEKPFTLESVQRVVRRALLAQERPAVTPA